MNEQELRQHIVNTAMKYLDKPYAHQASGPNFFDCIGLVGATGVEAGVVVWDKQDSKWSEFSNYSYIADPAMLAKGLSLYLVHILPKEDAGIGDIVWMREPDLPRHLGIITRLSPYMCIIHAYRKKNKVVHERLVNPGYIRACWRYPGLQDVIDG